MPQDKTLFDINTEIDPHNAAIVNIHVEGDLSFVTVPLVFEQTRHCFDQAQHVQFHLNNVQRADSAAMALILEWHRLAKEYNAAITLHDVPVLLKKIAHVTDLDSLLST
jgi:anti-anti-sigma factor